MNFTKTFVSYISVVIGSAITSIVFSWLLFGGLYHFIFQPTYTLSLLTMGGESFDVLLGGFLLAYALLLPIFSLIIVSKKQWLSWLIFIIPFIVFYFSSTQWLLYFAIFTIIGALLGWLIKFTYKKLKK